MIFVQQELYCCEVCSIVERPSRGSKLETVGEHLADD